MRDYVHEIWGISLMQLYVDLIESIFIEFHNIILGLKKIIKEFN